MQAQQMQKMSWQLQRFVANQAQTVRAKGNCFTGNNERLVMLAQGDDAALEPYCITHRGDIHIVSVPMDDIAALSENPGVRRMEVSFDDDRPLLDSTRNVVFSKALNDGVAPLQQAYDGTGVIVGNVDIGHDYTHPTFRSAKDGHLRIVRVWDQMDSMAIRQPDFTSTLPYGVLLTDTTAILQKAHSADAAITFHGTHTASTAAGSGMGTPYVGIAPESDIYLTTTALGKTYTMWPKEVDNNNGAMKMLAFSNIFAYADSVGRPCVINYSAGGTDSPLAGSNELSAQFMSRITGPGRIIVAATGNNGYRKYGQAHLTSDAPSCGGTMIEEGTTGRGYMMITARGRLKVKVTETDIHGTFLAVDSLLLDVMRQGDKLVSDSQLPINKATTVSLQALDSVTVALYAGYSTDSTMVAYEMVLRTVRYDNWYNIEFSLADGAGDAIIYTGDCNLEPYGTLRPLSPSGTVQSPACMEAVIGVGATSHRTGATSYKGEDISFWPCARTAKGAWAPFSSTGPTKKGLMKPDVVAPGNLVAAALSSFTEEGEYEDDNVVAEQQCDGRTYRYIAESGTSMSTPVVAGTIALWLQADPTLTKERIMDVIAKTSHQYTDTLSWPNIFYGYGEIDAYAGLMEVLGMTGIEGLTTRALPHSTATVRPMADGTIAVTFATATTAAVPCRIYSTAGTLVKSVTIPAGTVSCTIPLAHRGVVAVQVGSEGSTLVRLI